MSPLVFVLLAALCATGPVASIDVGTGLIRDVPNRARQHASSVRSTVTCDRVRRTCVMRNVYVVNGIIHAFVTEPVLKQLTETKIEVYTGIGFRSPVFRFKRADPHATTFVPEKDELQNFVYLHTEEIPVSFSRLPVVNEQSVLFSLLWDNIFRTLYAGTGAWYTLMESGLWSGTGNRLLLVDPARPVQFRYLIEAVSKHPVVDMNVSSDAAYAAMVIGISKNYGIPEITEEGPYSSVQRLRREAFWKFAKAIKTYYNPSQHSVPRRSRRPHVLFISRDSGLRRLINQAELVSQLQQMPLDVSLVSFDNMSFADQLRHVSQADALVTVHGAALAHTMFLRPGSFVVEIFPYEFRKTVYLNIARMMDVRYLRWQSRELNHSVFHWEYVERNRFTSLPQERVKSLPIIWNNMDSKNYWRNQDLLVDIPALQQVVDTFSWTWMNGEDARFLAYMPSGSAAHQILTLQAACRFAQILNRTLVLPLFRSESGVSSIAYQPVHRYLNMGALTELPCRYCLLENFVSLNELQSLGRLHYHPNLNLSLAEQFDYYNGQSPLTFSEVVNDPTDYPLDEKQIRDRYAQDSSRVLALGAIFFYFETERMQPRDYVVKQDPATLLSDTDIATSVQTAVKFRPYLLDMTRDILDGIDGRYVAIRLDERCPGSIDRLLSQLSQLNANTSYVYISNPSSRANQLIANRSFRAIALEDLLQEDDLEKLDGFEKVMLDLSICAYSDTFFGCSDSFSWLVNQRRSLL